MGGGGGFSVGLCIEHGIFSCRGERGEQGNCRGDNEGTVTCCFVIDVDDDDDFDVSNVVCDVCDCNGCGGGGIPSLLSLLLLLLILLEEEEEEGGFS